MKTRANEEYKLAGVKRSGLELRPELNEVDWSWGCWSVETRELVWHGYDIAKNCLKSLKAKARSAKANTTPKDKTKSDKSKNG
jgi:hypothetical protein